MSIDLKMPALSPTMEQGTLAKWLVGVGDAVHPGDILAEIETDKATMEFEADAAGRVTDLLIAEGTDDVPVGTVIIRLAALGDGDAATPPDRASVAPSRTGDAQQRAAPGEAQADSQPPHAAPAAIVTADGSQASRSRFAENSLVSPLAARIAAVRTIALDAITGSGPNGRIVRADLGLPGRRPRASVPTPVVPSVVGTARIGAAAPAGVPANTIRLGGMRTAIAHRPGVPEQTVPHVYLTIRCNIGALLATQTELNDALAPRGLRLSVDDLLIKAMATGMSAVPEVNVQFGGDTRHAFRRVDIAMAVAIDGGLVTPVIRDAGALSLSAIAEKCNALSALARDGKLGPEECRGGTASISNLGMFGIDEVIPVIDPPQALILGIGAALEMPWKVDGAVGLATIMTVTGGFDHRAIDEASAARFMSVFRDLMEAPMQLLG